LSIGVLGFPSKKVSSQSSPQTSTPSRANILRGEYGRYRANNDLLYYHLDVRVDPEKKYLSGSTLIRFKMLKPDNRIQLDLHEALKVDRVEWVIGTGERRLMTDAPNTEPLQYSEIQEHCL